MKHQTGGLSRLDRIPDLFWGHSFAMCLFLKRCFGAGDMLCQGNRWGFFESQKGFLFKMPLFFSITKHRIMVTVGNMNIARIYVYIVCINIWMNLGKRMTWSSTSSSRTCFGGKSHFCMASYPKPFQPLATANQGSTVDWTRTLPHVGCLKPCK